MTTTTAVLLPADACRWCAGFAEHLAPGASLACDHCGAEYERAAESGPPPVARSRVRARPLAPLPPPDVVGRDRSDDDAAPLDARRDLEALARYPAIQAQCLEPVRAAPDEPALDPADDAARVLRERAHERTRARAQRAARRLAAMVARGPDGRRWAALVWRAYGVWSETRRGWAGSMDEIAATFTTRAEREAWRAWFIGQYPRIKQNVVDLMERRALGNALLALATEAYGLDRWGALPTGAAPCEDAP